MQNLKQFIDFLNISTRSFEQKVGLTNGTVSRIIQQGQSLRHDKICMILECYPDLNANWLLMNKGEMLLSTEIITDQNIEGSKDALADYLEKKVEEKEERIKELQENLTNAKEIIASLRTELNFKTGYEDNKNKNI